MMKKYNKPEIETLALETVDVIAVSTASETTLVALGDAVASANQGKQVTVQRGNETLRVDTSWQW